MTTIEYINMTAKGPINIVTVQIVTLSNFFLPGFGDVIDIEGTKYNVDDRICRMLEDYSSYHIIYELQEIR